MGFSDKVDRQEPVGSTTTDGKEVRARQLALDPKPSTCLAVRVVDERQLQRRPVRHNDPEPVLPVRGIFNPRRRRLHHVLGQPLPGHTNDDVNRGQVLGTPVFDRASRARGRRADADLVDHLAGALVAVVVPVQSKVHLMASVNRRANEGIAYVGRISEGNEG